MCVITPARFTTAPPDTFGTCAACYGARTRCRPTGNVLRLPRGPGWLPCPPACLAHVQHASARESPSSTAERFRARRQGDSKAFEFDAYLREPVLQSGRFQHTVTRSQSAEPDLAAPRAGLVRLERYGLRPLGVSVTNIVRRCRSEDRAKRWGGGSPDHRCGWRVRRGDWVIAG